MPPQKLHGDIYNTLAHDCQNLEETNTTVAK